jgi:PAS domain S-box-containing protein
MRDQSKTKKQLIEELEALRALVNSSPHQSYVEAGSAGANPASVDDLFRAVFIESPDVILIVDADTKKILTANPAAERLLLHPLAALIGQDLTMLVPEKRESNTDSIVNALANDHVNPSTTAIRRADDVSVTMEARASSVRWNGSSALMVTLRESRPAGNIEAEGDGPAHYRSDEIHRLVLENANETVFVVQGSHIKYANPRTFEFSGYSENELLSLPFIELIHPDDRHKVIERYRLRLNGEPVDDSYQIRVTDKHGNLHWVLVNAVLTEWKGEAAVLVFATDISDLKEAERELQESEARYRLLAESSLTGIFVHEMGQVVYVNQRMADMLGYTVDEIIGRHFIDSIHEDDRERVMDFALARADGRDAPDHYETRLICKNGDVKWVEILAKAVSIDDRPAIVGNIADITERRQAEEALRQAEERYRNLVEQIPAITYVYCLDESAGGDYVSPQVETLLGIQQEDYASNPETWRRHLHPDDQDRVMAEIARCHATGQRFVAEYRMLSTDDRVIWFRDEAVPLPDRDGRPALLQGIMLDITERKYAEEELRKSEERFRTIFESAHDCVFIKDRNLKYTHVNPAMLKVLRLRKSEIIGRSDEDIFGREAVSTITELEERVLKGQIIEAEYNLDTKSGVSSFSSVRVPMRSQSGDITAICGIARDVTERRMRELDSSGQTDEYPSEAMNATLQKIRLAAKSDSIVLFLGESGSGKDYLSRYLHDHSRRAGGPFFTINCAALTAELAESELFGHEAGAFTGSSGRKRGLLELAEAGTLLLNEIGELSPQLQAKLLTFLDTQMFTRVGGEKNISVNARLVAATNRDLEKEVENKAFRSDLYYRLNVFTIKVPPLRERMDDLPILVGSILESLARKMGLPGVPVAEEEEIERLRDYHWPGNVRELRNVLERALILGHGSTIRSADLRLSDANRPEEGSKAMSFTVQLPDGGSMHDAIQEAKRLMVLEGLRRSGGNVTNAAELLGISRDSMKHHMKSLNIRR